MKDYARIDQGASVILATSVDDRFPPDNVLDGEESFGAEAIGTFWMTTGMFPQELVIALAKPVQVSQIVIMMLNVKKLSVEKCDSDKPTNFERVFEAELQSREGRLQTERHQVNIKAKFIKLTLHSGYSEFAAVNRISVIGADGNDRSDDSYRSNITSQVTNNTSSYQQQQQQPAYGQPAYGNLAEEEEEEEVNNHRKFDQGDGDDDDDGYNPGGHKQPPTYGGGRTEDEYSAKGAAHEDEF